MPGERIDQKCISARAADNDPAMNLRADHDSENPKQRDHIIATSRPWANSRTTEPALASSPPRTPPPNGPSSSLSSTSGRASFYVRRGPLWLLVAVLALIGATQTLTASITALALLFLLSLGLLVLAMTFFNTPYRDILAVVAIQPLIEIWSGLVNNLSPWQELTASGKSIVVSLLVIISCLALARSLTYTMHQLGLGTGHLFLSLHKPGPFTSLRKGLAALLRVIVQVGIAVVGSVLIVWSTHTFPDLNTLFTANITTSSPWLTAVVLTLMIFNQELLFRGLLQRAAIKALGIPLGITYALICFSFFFLGFLSLGQAGLVIGIGLLAASSVQLTGSLWGVIGAQAIAGILLLGILELPFF